MALALYRDTRCPIGGAVATRAGTIGSVTLLETTGRPVGKVKMLMQTAVQTTTDASTGSHLSGTRSGAKGKEPGGFAALLAALFGKGGQPKGGEKALAAGAQEAGAKPSVKGEAVSPKKGTAPADAKTLPKKPLSPNETDEDEKAPVESGLLPGLAATPLFSLAMKGEPIPGAAQAKAPAEGVEKSAGADKQQGPALPALKGGMEPRPLSAGPASGAVPFQPQVPGEVGVDRFAAMMRDAAPMKKTAGSAAQPAGSFSAMPGAPLAPTAAGLLAGAASMAGAKTARPEAGVKGDAAKKGGGLEAPPVAAGAAALLKKEAPRAGAAEPSIKVAPSDAPSAASLRLTRPVAPDHAGPASHHLTAEGLTALNEMDSSAPATEAPKSGFTRQLALQVGRQIATSLQKNETEVTFQVRPPSLGRIQIRIEKEGEGVSVRIVSEKESSGEILSAGKHELRALLADHGIRVDRIDVEAGGAMNLMAQGGGSEDRGGRGRSSPRQGGSGHGRGTADPEAAPSETGRHEGVISVRA